MLLGLFHYRLTQKNCTVYSLSDIGTKENYQLEKKSQKKSK